MMRLRKARVRSSAGAPKVFSGGPLLLHAAAVEEADLARDLAGEAHLVGGEQHGHALLHQIAHDVQDLRDQLGIERRGDLVEQQHQRVHGERARDGDALLLPARQAVGILYRLQALRAA